MSRFPEEQQIKALSFMTKRERDILLVGARDAGGRVAVKFWMPGLPELKRLKGIPTKEDYFFAFAQWCFKGGGIKGPRSKWHQQVVQEANDRGDTKFLIRLGKFLHQGEVPIPLAELWLTSFWIRRGKASFYENLCLWSDKALAEYLNNCLNSSYEEPSFRKMRQRLKLGKSKFIVINGHEKRSDGKGYRLIFKT